MRVEVAYEGRVEVFDTDRFTEAQPFSGRSMLADFTLEYEAAEKNGLWLTAHCYAANEGYRTDGEEVPEARREKGWKFQLASPKEAGELESVAMDGETVLARMFGELVDVMKLDRASALFAGPGGRKPHGAAERLPLERGREARGELCPHGGGDRRRARRARARHSSRGRPDGARGRRRERLDGRIRR